MIIVSITSILKKAPSLSPSVAIPSSKLVRKSNFHGSQFPDNPSVVVIHPGVTDKGRFYTSHVQQGTTNTEQRVRVSGYTHRVVVIHTW